jgi:hypothetical protein
MGFAFECDQFGFYLPKWSKLGPPSRLTRKKAGGVVSAGPTKSAWDMLSGDPANGQLAAR